jgi:hypothetical protein
MTYKTYSGLNDWIYWHLIRQLGTTGNHSATAISHTSQFTVTHALGFSVFTSRILATDFITVSLSLQITHEVFFALPNSFLAIILQLSTQFISPLPSSCPGRLASRNSIRLGLLRMNFFITTLHGPRRKQPIIGKAYLQCRSIATQVTRLLLAYSLPRECVYRVVA